MIWSLSLTTKKFYTMSWILCCIVNRTNAREDNTKFKVCDKNGLYGECVSFRVDLVSLLLNLNWNSKYFLWVNTCSKSTKKTLDKLSLKALVPLLLTSNRYLSTRYLLVSLAFLSGFSFTNIHDSKDSREDGWLSLWLLSAISTCLTDTKTSAGQLLQGTHLCS